MDKIFYPDSIVVIGVSERPDNLAANIIRNLQSFGYSGDIYAVGLRSGEVYGIPILTSVKALPDGVNLAVILTPAATVPGLMDACGQKGIRRAVIESGGFGEFSEAGRKLEEQVCEVARRWGIRFVGPNCISAVNLENGLCLPFTTLDRQAVKLGPVSVLAQSGGVSVTYLHLLSEARLGVNKVVSMGNKADLDEVDYLTYLMEDPGTEVICLYLESIEGGRRLIELAASSPRPVIVQKANIGQMSARIAFSHTAALANDDRIVSAALRQAGIAHAGSFQDAVTLAQGFALPPVRGNDLFIISRSGGHAVVAADTAEAYGFYLPPVPDDFLVKVQGLFRADVIALTNPIDVGVIFNFDLYGDIAEECLRMLDPAALLMVHTYTTGPEAEVSRRLIRRIEQLIRQTGKPIAFCPFAQESEVVALEREVEFPTFATIEGAVRALATSRDRYTRTARLLTLPSTPAQRPHEVEGLLAHDGVLTTDTALGLCAAFGIPTAEWAVVENTGGALVAASGVGYPVALKVLSPDVSHKSDAGGVVLGVESQEALRAEFAALLARVEERAPGARVAGVLVQQMLAGGREVILGGKHDPSFGPMVMFGLGGVYVEVFEDVAFRLAPLTRDEAKEMISEVRGSLLLRGVRGEPPVDIEAVVDALLALSRLLVECPEVVEVDVNPLLVFERGVAAVDARVVVINQKT
ncbi:MAG: acetate--CoA ligase family protein [Chloroflexota bacterium]|nr:acetate--CoA ligase family protein [Chloroflexota bacterium]